MVNFYKKIWSTFLCGTLIFALVPTNIGLSAKKGGEVITGTNLSIESDSSDVLSEKDRVVGNDDSAKFGEPAGKENENLSGNSGGIDKVWVESKKDTGDNKGANEFLFAKSNVSSNSMVKDVAKVTGGVGAGAVAGVVVTKVAMSNSVGNKDGGSTEKGLENVNEELENVKAERDALRKQNENFENIPAHRAWLWGFLSYPLGWLKLLGEGQNDTETLAIKNSGLRIMFSVIWFFASLFTTLVVLVLNRKLYCKNAKAKILGAVPTTALVWLCPPVGVLYGVSAGFFLSYSEKN